MKFKFVFTITILSLLACTLARPQDEEGDGEASPPLKKPARPLIGRRNPLAGKGAKAATTTSTTTAAPQEEEPIDEGEYVDEEQQPIEETSSTTEAPKSLLKGNMVRPFRSNDDLLAALKRRREQAVHGKPAPKSAPVEKQDEAASEVQRESKPAPSQASSGRRNRFSKAKTATTENEASSTAAPVRTGRRFGGR